jgi:hypothetical protein
MVNGDIESNGVLTHEGAVPPEKFIEEWRKRNINIIES